MWCNQMFIQMIKINFWFHLSLPFSLYCRLFAPVYGGYGFESLRNDSLVQGQTAVYVSTLGYMVCQLLLLDFLRGARAFLASWQPSPNHPHIISRLPLSGCHP